jgi:hypothetical protein
MMSSALERDDKASVFAEHGAEPWGHRDAAKGRTAARVSGKWSARKTLIFVLVVCGGFWAAVYLGLHSILK